MDPSLRGCRKKHKSLEPRRTRRPRRKRKALLCALRGSLLFRAFCDNFLRECRKSPETSTHPTRHHSCKREIRRHLPKTAQSCSTCSRHHRALARMASLSSASLRSQPRKTIDVRGFFRSSSWCCSKKCQYRLFNGQALSLALAFTS